MLTRIRAATPTVGFVDEHCAYYRALFSNVRHFEQFTQQHLGLLAETKRKSLPRLAKSVQADHQALHHFLANAEWSVEEMRTRRLALLQQAVGDQLLIVCLDETGDRKKGQTTDYAAHQYIGNIGGLANGVVSVNAYGVLGTTTFPWHVASSSPAHVSRPVTSTRAIRCWPSSCSRNSADAASASAWCSPTVSMGRVAM